MESLPLGQIVTLVQNQIYALPANRSLLFTDATTPTIQQSNTAGFTANVVVTLTAGSAQLSGRFLRTTSSGVVATLTRA